MSPPKYLGPLSRTRPAHDGAMPTSWAAPTTSCWAWADCGRDRATSGWTGHCRFGGADPHPLGRCTTQGTSDVEQDDGWFARRTKAIAASPSRPLEDVIDRTGLVPARWCVPVAVVLAQTFR